jgi:transposase
MVGRSGDATALLGMEGFVVLAMDQTEGEWWLLVETTSDVGACPSCGVRAIGHGRSAIQVRDLPSGGCPVRLVWRKRQWRCADADCDRKTFTEQNPLVEGSLTQRTRDGDLPGGRRGWSHRGRAGPVLRHRLVDGHDGGP